MIGPPPVLPGSTPFAPTGPGDLAFQKKLQETQWWPTERILDHQLGLAQRLLAHAHRTVPLQRRRIDAAGIAPGAPLSLDAWRRLKPLTRKELQQGGPDFVSTQVPNEHGEIVANSSSGSTGVPITVSGSVFDACVFKCVNLRHFLWHPHDFSGRLAVIRHVGGSGAEYPSGAAYDRWGDTATFPFSTGPAVVLSIRASISEQAEWLSRQDPDYLLSYPSNLLELARHCARRGIKLPYLEHASTLGEVVNAEVREAVREAWDAPLIDTYSAHEVGMVADQCPSCEQYHIQAETILVEVVDAAGVPCAPGQIGRVLVTPLFNYATPLLRYDLGDYAEVGAPCACGRGLPVLRQILGRERNALLVAPTGERYWPAFGSRKFTSIAPILQHQFAQKDSAWLEGRLVTERPLTPDEEEQLRTHIQGRLPCPFRITFAYVDDIPRNAGGKFENFVSELAS
ncbi:MAG TPA: phenylacetate--CoA ligase family protein [Casimicrobiaceae bacterium]|nr:phenylacetate--CoA ligase family protein [Casimicrobiaceae bacterium]